MPGMTTSRMTQSTGCSAKLLQRARPIRREGHPKTRHFQRRPEQQARSGIVVDDEYAGGHIQLVFKGVHQVPAPSCGVSRFFAHERCAKFLMLPADALYERRSARSSALPQQDFAFLHRRRQARAAEVGRCST